MRALSAFGTKALVRKAVRHTLIQRLSFMCLSTPKPSHGRRGNPSDSDLRAFARCLSVASDLGANCCNQRVNDVLVLDARSGASFENMFLAFPAREIVATNG